MTDLSKTDLDVSQRKSFISPGMDILRGMEDSMAEIISHQPSSAGPQPPNFKFPQIQQSLSLYINSFPKNALPQFDPRISYDQHFDPDAKIDPETFESFLTKIYDSFDLATLDDDHRKLIVSYESVLGDCIGWIAKLEGEAAGAQSLAGLKSDLEAKEREIDRLVVKIQEIRMEQIEIMNFKIGKNRDNVGKMRRVVNGGGGSKGGEYGGGVSTEDSVDPVNDDFLSSMEEVQSVKSRPGKKGF
jgi:hypothetical protein